MTKLHSIAPAERKYSTERNLGLRGACRWWLGPYDLGQDPIARSAGGTRATIVLGAEAATCYVVAPEPASCAADHGRPGPACWAGPGAFALAWGGLHLHHPRQLRVHRRGRRGSKGRAGKEGGEGAGQGEGRRSLHQPDEHLQQLRPGDPQGPTGQGGPIEGCGQEDGARSTGHGGRSQAHRRAGLSELRRGRFVGGEAKVCRRPQGQGRREGGRRISPEGTHTSCWLAATGKLTATRRALPAPTAGVSADSGSAAGGAPRPHLCTP